ncbi:MAG: winged helix-turn-helix transcriptional regulator [Nitrososphaerales archaeon]
MIEMARKLDSQEVKIVKALVKNPRLSDNQIGKKTGVPIRTVNRKRKKMEEEGLLRYYTELHMGAEGTGRFNARHLYLVKFKMGISQSRIIKEVKEEPNVRTVFTDFIYESHIAEIEGHTALALIIEGGSDDEINTKFNEIMVPSLEKNHGKESIIEITTIRLGKPIRLFHNYLPMVNMVKGKINVIWADEAILAE